MFYLPEFIERNLSKINAADMNRDRLKTVARYHGVRYGNFDDDPIPSPIDLSAQFGNDAKEEFKQKSKSVSKTSSQMAVVILA